MVYAAPGHTPVRNDGAISGSRRLNDASGVVLRRTLELEGKTRNLQLTLQDIRKEELMRGAQEHLMWFKLAISQRDRLGKRLRSQQ